MAAAPRYPARKGGKAPRKRRRRRAQQGGALESAARAPRQSDVFSILTGSNIEELTREAGESPFARLETGSSEPAHALASQRIAERFGVPISQAVGLANELLTGGAALAAGEDFFSPTGFDIKDLAVNQLGIGEALRTDPGSALGGIGSAILSRITQPRRARSPVTRPTDITGIRGQKGGKVGKVLGEFKRGKLRSGSKRGPKVTSRNQALAIALDEARRAGENVPRRRAQIGGIASQFGEQPFFQTPEFLAAPTGFDTTQLNLPRQVQAQLGRIEDIRPDTGELESIVGQLRGFQAGGSDIIQGLQNFQPFSDVAQGTLNELLTTGLPTDVSGATEAARIRATQEFDDAQDRIGERLAALGLTSSTARQAAIGRERARLGERIGAAGLEAEIGAQEAAAGRRAGALSPALQGAGQRLAGQQAALTGALGQSGQRLSALGTAAGGAGQAATLGLRGAESRAGAGQNLLSTIGSPSFGRGPAPTAGRPLSGGRSGSGILGARMQLSPGAGFGGIGARRQLAQEGGRVRGLEEFIRNTGADVLRGRGVLSSDPQVLEQQGLAALGGEDLAQEIFRNPELLGSLENQAQEFFKGRRFGVGTIQPANRAQALALGVGQRFAPARVRGGLRAGDRFIGTAGDLDRTLRQAAGSEALAPRNLGQAVDLGDRRRTFQGGGPVGRISPQLPQEQGQQIPSVLDPRRAFFQGGGGTAPGIDDGTDKIPALLRSEELVVTPEVTDDIETANPFEVNPELIIDLQELADKPLEFDEGEGEFVAQRGGATGDFGPRGGATGGFGEFDLAPVDILELLTAGAIPEIRRNIPLIQRVAPEIQRTAVAEGRAALGLDPRLPATPETLASGRNPFEAILGPGGAELAPITDVPQVDFGEAAGGDFAVPGGVSRPGRFVEDVGEAGERRFTLEGGERGAPGPQISTGRGTVSSPAIRLDDDTLLRDRIRRPNRLESALSRVQSLRTALVADPIGGPEKQARLQRALQGAQREVESSVNELVASERLRIQRQAAQAQTLQAQANLNTSIARTLQAQSQKATAEAALAKQLQESAAQDPFLAQVLNAFETQGKVAADNPEAAAQLDAVIRRLFETRGVQLTESGSIARLFGAPEFEIQPIQPEVGQPGGEGAESVAGLLGRPVSDSEIAALQALGVGI